MNPSRHCSWILCLLASGASSAIAAEPADYAAKVVAQQLHAPAAWWKISTVLWTRRTDSYTLQIVFARTGGIPGYVNGRSIMGPNGEPPVVTAWLLRADGTTISAERNPPEKVGKKAGVPLEIQYKVPLAAGEQAVAAAVRVDNEYFIEALHSLVTR